MAAEEPHPSNPFLGMKLAPFDALRNAARVECDTCKVSRRYWCGKCNKLLVNGLAESPILSSLPLKFEVFQAKRESPQKSTAGQAATLSPSHVHVWRDLNQLRESVTDPDSIAILYPSDDSIPISDLPSQVDSLLVIDGPWSWAAQQLENPFLSGLKRVRLTTNGRRTAYWRYPPLRGAASNFNPTAVLQCMSTVEAIHQCCLEIDGEGGARGLYDNLLWLFAFQYSTVSRALRENPSRMQRVVRKSRGVLNPERFGH